MPGQDIGAELRHSLRLLVVATLVLYVAVLVLSFLGWRDARDKRESLRREAARTTAALCTFRHDIEQRVQSSKDFLIAHPEGFAGIPAATIRVSLKAQQSTVDALKTLDCTVKGA